MSNETEVAEEKVIADMSALLLKNLRGNDKSKSIAKNKIKGNWGLIQTLNSLSAFRNVKMTEEDLEAFIDGLLTK